MQITPFNTAITRDAFDCGEPALNHYLQQLAGQHSRKNVSRTFVAIDNDTVTGFYSLSMAESVGRFAYRYPQEITPTIPSACRPLEPLGSGQNLPRATHG